MDAPSLFHRSCKETGRLICRPVSYSSNPASSKLRLAEFSEMVRISPSVKPSGFLAWISMEISKAVPVAMMRSRISRLMVEMSLA